MTERGATELLAAAAGALEERLPGRVERSVPVADLTTYRLGGPAALLVRCATVDDLHAVAGVLAAVPLEVLVVGRGSNLLVADRGFAGLAIVLTGEFEEIAIGADTVVAGGGAALPVLARRCAAEGRTGLEFYVGIPGSVGGAVRMNAGGHGRETAEVIRHAEVFDLGTATPRSVPTAGLHLSYRHSGLGPREVVVAAGLAVSPDERGACEARLTEVVRWRREHQPGGSNAGSVFTNPPGDSAGRIIDSLGLKGLRVGGARVSEKHANFFQAGPGSTASDVHALIMEVIRRVEEATGIRLVPELSLVGFTDPARTEP